MKRFTATKTIKANDGHSSIEVKITLTRGSKKTQSNPEFEEGVHQRSMSEQVRNIGKCIAYDVDTNFGLDNMTVK